MDEADKIIEQAKNEKKYRKKQKKKEEAKPRLYTGSTIRDIILGGTKGIMGVKVGVIWNVIGLSSTGKTFEINELIAVNRHFYGNKFKWNYDATSEGGNDVDCEKLYGFPVITEKTLRSFTVEEMSVNIKKFLLTLNEGDIGCYVVDSLDGLTSQEIQKRIDERFKKMSKGQKYDEGSYKMAKAAVLKQEIFPDIKPLIEKSNCLLIIVSQQTKKVNQTYGNPKSRAGGDALRFFSHIESWTRKVDNITRKYKGKEYTKGMRSLIGFEKTRNSKAFRSHYNTFYTEDYGLDDLSDNIDFLFDLLTDGGADSSGESSHIKLKALDGIMNKEDMFKIFCDNNATKKQLEKIDELREAEKDWYITKWDLIPYVEDNNLEPIIKQKTIDKWYDIEEHLKVERKKRFV